MRRFLFASAAASGLMLSASAFAQLPDQVIPPAPPAAAVPDVQAPAVRAPLTPAPAAPVMQEPQMSAPDVQAQTTGEGAVSAQSTAPDMVGGAETQAQAQAELTGEGVPAVNAETQAEAEASAAADAPSVTAQAAPAATAETQAEASAAMEAPRATAEAAAAASAQVAENAALPTPMSAEQVCQPRTTSVHFGARGSALSQQNSNAIQYAVDGASACNLDGVVIAASGQGAAATRRANAIRSVLERQGVPADRITIEEASSDVDASTGQTQVRMTFRGNATANSGAVLASNATGRNAAASDAMAQPSASVQAPAVEAPAAMPAPSADAGADADANADAALETPAEDGPNS